jgi:hypothetical protein
MARVQNLLALAAWKSGVTQVTIVTVQSEYKVAGSGRCSGLIYYLACLPHHHHHHNVTGANFQPKKESKKEQKKRRKLLIK